jgi:hypothetical protein
MSSDSDEEFAQVKTWGDDLMGEASDRRRYFHHGRSFKDWNK